jgi:hypothetical protein
LKFLAPLFKTNQGDDIPSSVDFSREDFLTYRETWLRYRSIGRYDSNDRWISPISFVEAMDLPSAMLDVFQQLDDFFEQMKKQYMKKTQGTIK